MEERSAGIVIATIKIDRRELRAIAAKNLKSGIIGDGGGARNVHADRSVAADRAVCVIDPGIEIAAD